ncbi:MAG: HAD-IA family hydrolase [Deltaproteobacteria bacterium]|nr:HAD-IA family hydrolase [Deltaproteobacteria bacterium]
MEYKYQIIIYDLDSTLIDSQWDIADSLVYVLNELKINCPEYSQIVMGHRNGALAYLKTLLTSEVTFERAAILFKKHLLANLTNKTCPFPHVTETLSSLRRDIKQVILTDKPSEFTTPTIASLKIEGYFDAIYSGDSFTEKKPSAQPVLEILTTFNIPKEKALIVGDSIKDILCGKNAGIDTCGVTYGTSEREALEALSPTYVIEDFAELSVLARA